MRFYLQMTQTIPVDEWLERVPWIWKITLLIDEIKDMAKKNLTFKEF